MMLIMVNRSPSKLACTQGYEGGSSLRTAAYLNVREEQSTDITYKSPAEVEFRKRSNIFLPNNSKLSDQLSTFTYKYIF